MLIKKAERVQQKARIGIFGASGSGKTYSALLMARGLTEWDKICVIDTERGSSNLYEDLGGYAVGELEPPFSPEKYINAIQTAVSAGYEVIIIDSISHEWEGRGGCLDIHAGMAGNSYTNWSKVTPRHNAFIDAILDSPVHMICCGRSKQDVVLEENDRGRQTPRKVGLKAVTREGFDYEMTLCFDIDAKHYAASSKDRTSLFIDQPSVVITPGTGKQLLDWLNSGKEALAPEVVAEMDELKESLKGVVKAANLNNEKFAEITGLGFDDVNQADVERLNKANELLSNWFEKSVGTLEAKNKEVA